MNLHSLPNSIIDSNMHHGNQLVQDLKDITRFKSTSVFGTDFSANSKPSLQRLIDSIVGIHESNISLLRSSDDHDNIVFPWVSLFYRTERNVRSITFQNGTIV